MKAGAGLVGCVTKRSARPLGPVAKRIWHTARPGQYGNDLDWSGGHFFNNLKVDPEKPSPTIPKGFSGGGGHMHWEEPRSLSIQEVARLTSFPDPFEFIGSFEQQWARIGNSVPPMMMRAIAAHVAEAMLS